MLTSDDNGGDTEEVISLRAELRSRAAIADVALRALDGASVGELLREVEDHIVAAVGEGHCELFNGSAVQTGPFEGIAAPLPGPEGAPGELRFHTQCGASEGDKVLLQTMARILGSTLARAHREQGLVKSAEGLETTLYSIGDAAIAANERACVTRMNPAAEALTGSPESETRDRPLDVVTEQRRREEATQLMDDFVSVAGHELKTPLGAALLQLQLLTRMVKEPTPTARIVERVEKVIRNLNRLGTLINDLLDVSRITAGRLVLAREDVDLSALTQEVLARHADELVRAGCDVHVTAAAPVVGAWDRTRIEQVLSNLLTNAVKYGKGKPLEVTVSATDGTAHLVVRDHGIGIAPADQARIFERFERAVSSQKVGGLGLGLWIAHQIVDAHGGTIRLESTPGAGAQFDVELPVHPGEGS